MDVLLYAFPQPHIRIRVEEFVNINAVIAGSVSMTSPIIDEALSAQEFSVLPQALLAYTR